MLSGFENFTRGVVDVTRVFNISTAILLEDQQITEADLRQSLDALQKKFAMLQCYVAPIGNSEYCSILITNNLVEHFDWRFFFRAGRRYQFVEMNPIKPIELNIVEFKDEDATQERITHQLELELNNPLGSDKICR